MPNLRNMETGKKLVQQVMLQQGSSVKQITKQAEVKPPSPKNKKPKLPSKFSAQP